MPQRSDRFNAVAQGLHWLTALLIFTTLPIAWIMQSMAHGAHRDVYVDVHKSIGLTILLLTLVRIAWRSRGTPDDWLSPVFSVLARTSHLALYVLLLAMPVTGYMQSAATGHSAAFFWLFDIRALPPNRALGDAAIFIHNVLRWPLYGLIAAHLAATLFHVAWLRDGTLERMLPTQKRVPDGTRSSDQKSSVS